MTSDMHATWAYDWSDNPREKTSMETAPAGVDLVAMFDSKSNYSSLASSSYKEVIGWNEPDVTTAPVDSATAAQDWPNIVNTVGKRMGSPAVAHTDLTVGDWLYDFMTAVIKAGGPPDFICLHYYSPNGDVSNFKRYIKVVYDMYKLPIWVTEWAYIAIRSEHCRPGDLYAGGGKNDERLGLCRPLSLIRGSVEQCTTGK